MITTDGDDGNNARLVQLSRPLALGEKGGRVSFRTTVERKLVRVVKDYAFPSRLSGA